MKLVIRFVLRIAQGFGVGGEWGGAVLMAVEHSPKGKRGFYGSWPQIGVPAGLLLSTVIFAQISKLPDEALLTWGWRVAFLLSFVLVGVGLFIRLAVVEPPMFANLKQAGTGARMPILDAVRDHPKSVLLAMGADEAARPAELGSRRSHRWRSFIDWRAQICGAGRTGSNQRDAGYASKQKLFHRSPQGERVEPGRSFTKQGPPKQWQIPRFPSILVSCCANATFPDRGSRPV